MTIIYLYIYVYIYLYYKYNRYIKTSVKIIRHTANTNKDEG